MFVYGGSAPESSVDQKSERKMMWKVDRVWLLHLTNSLINNKYLVNWCGFFYVSPVGFLVSWLLCQSKGHNEP